MAKHSYTGNEQYRPLGAWAYFGYTVLFNIPVVGFICLIIFSFLDSNINRRNYARSYWCVYIVILLIVALTLILSFVIAGTDAVLAFWNKFYSALASSLRI